MLGTSISHFRIESELGRGGMGIVYKALDTKLDRTVALKLLPSAMLISDEERSRFYREARSAAALSHPHIATVYAIDEAVPEGSRADDIRPFIAMEYIDGPSLSQRIQEGPVGLDDATKITIQLASALQTAHDHDIVHRDIKSSNVMLTAKGDVKVLDFGLAKTLQSTRLTMTGSTLGTASYMSPEQARGEDVDGRSDLWSLGVVLYEMVSGLLPFAGSYDQAVVYAILNENPRPLTAIRTGVPMELERVVDKLLEKDRALRYQSAADVLADLKRLEITLGGGSRITGTSSAPAPGGKPPRDDTRRGFRPIHGVTALLLIVAGATCAWLLTGDTASQRMNPVGPIHLNLLLPDSVVFDDPYWSADGTRILFSADQGDRKGFIVEYDLRTGTLTELTDADLNLWPKYAPDGRAIYFVSSGGILMRQDIGSTQAGPVTKVDRKDGFNWISPSKIVFARSRAVLAKDLVSGVEDTLRSRFPGSNWFHHPVVAPGSSVLFAGTYVGTRAIDLETREMLPSLEMDGYFFGMTSNGYILYEPWDLRTIWARKFDAKTQAYEGQGSVVLRAEGGRLAVSGSGNLIFKPQVEPDAPLYIEPIYVYTSGKRGRFVAHAGTYTEGDHGDFRISPNGRYLAVTVLQGGILRFERSSHTTIELVESSVHGQPDQFSYDGRWLYYTVSSRSEDRSCGPPFAYRVYRIDSDARKPPELVVSDEQKNASGSISRDGNTLVFQRCSQETDWDIWGKDLSTGEEFPVAEAERRQRAPSISPDARFVAFESYNVRGERSVLVKDVVHDETVAVADGVGQPRWDQSGAYLYYESTIIGQIYRVPFRYTNEMTFGERETMYSDPRSDHTHWDIAPEENTILVSAPEGSLQEGSEWKVVLNWAQTLGR